MSRSVIYAYGFDGDEASIEATVVALGMTAFNVVMLPCLHVGSEGELFLNETPVTRLSRALEPELTELKTGFSHSKQVLLSIGPNPSDFLNISRDLRRVLGRIARFAERHAIDGIDIDYSGDYSADDAALLARIAREYLEISPHSIVTAAPYREPAFWGRVVKQTADGKGNLLSWLNLQFYEGASNFAPTSYLDHFVTWMSAIDLKRSGITKPAEFLVPGCNATVPGFGPAEMATALGNVRNKYPDIGGGFVWNYVGLNAPVKEWGKAISKAVAP